MQGDAQAVRRLVLNLLSNAQKNTHAGSIAIRAGWFDQDGHSCVRIQVTDTGEGMEPETARRLGIAFALNSGVVGEDHVKGSGLGLSICRGIVAAHGGHISVETSPGNGTMVTVVLRADLAEPAPMDEAGPIEAKVNHA